MIELNTDFIDPYIINNNMNIVNTDLNEYITSIKNNHLNILHMNIRSYNHNIDEVWCLINDSISSLDIIIFSETWNSTGFVPHDIIDFSSFKSVINFNQNDGVLIYINNNLHGVSVEQQPLFSEASCLKINLKANNKQITILATYRSPKSNINIFLSELNTLLTSGVLQNNCVWIGDINIDILELNTSISTENYLNTLSSNGFISQICTYTREVNEIKSCIDHLFSRDVHLHTVVIKTSTTDHYTIIGSLIISLNN